MFINWIFQRIPVLFLIDQYWSQSLILFYLHFCLHLRPRFKEVRIRQILTIYLIISSFWIQAYILFFLLIFLEVLRYLLPYWIRVRKDLFSETLLKRTIRALSNPSPQVPLLKLFQDLFNGGLALEPMTDQEWDDLFSGFEYIESKGPVILNRFVILRPPQAYFARDYTIQRGVSGDCQICKGQLPEVSFQIRCGHRFCPGCLLDKRQLICPICNEPLNGAL